MIDNLLDNVLKEIQLGPDLFVEIVEMGMKNPDDRKIFEQIIACNSFLSFKKLMTKRNEEIQVEVVKSMKTEGIASEQDLDLALEKQEIAEVGYALALSIAWEEEQRKKFKENEEELERALRESEAEYKRLNERNYNEQEERERLAREKLKFEKTKDLNFNWKEKE
jgi:VIT1/CCC1 family predicted Fe2+/Mn2+ transporter